MKLDSFRKGLLKTEISKYVDFQPEYDPFLINLKLKKCHSDTKCNEAIQTLMDFVVEDSYKYLKMGKTLMDWIYMHSRKTAASRNLDRIDLPDLKRHQQYVDYDKLKDELMKERLR